MKNTTAFKKFLMGIAITGSVAAACVGCASSRTATYQSRPTYWSTIRDLEAERVQAERQSRADADQAAELAAAQERARLLEIELANERKKQTIVTNINMNSSRRDSIMLATQNYVNAANAKIDSLERVRDTIIASDMREPGKSNAIATIDNLAKSIYDEATATAARNVRTCDSLALVIQQGLTQIR